MSGRVVRRKDKSLEDAITSRCCRKVLCLVVEEHRRETYIDVAWREVRGGWKKEAQRHPKLEGIESLMEQECEGRGMMVKCKRRRRRLVKLRGGTAELEVETGRWCGVRREERICKNCRGGEVEDVRHLVMRCTYVEEEREKLEELMSERVKEWQGMDDNVKVTVVMDRACTDEDVGRAVERMWQRRFAAHGPHPSMSIEASISVGTMVFSIHAPCSIAWRIQAYFIRGIK